MLDCKRVLNQPWISLDQTRTKEDKQITVNVCLWSEQANITGAKEKLYNNSLALSQNSFLV